jgi:hypothetical protein
MGSIQPFICRKQRAKDAATRYSPVPVMKKGVVNAILDFP